MANKKKSSSSNSSSNKHTVSLNKVAFWTIVSAAILYLVGIICSAIGFGSARLVVGVLQGIATAVMVTIVSIVAWRYVSKKQVVWKVLYFVCLLIVVVGIIIPLVL